MNAFISLELPTPIAKCIPLLLGVVVPTVEGGIALTNVAWLRHIVEVSSTFADDVQWTPANNDFGHC